MAVKPTYEALENRIRELEKEKLKRTRPKDRLSEGEEKYREIANRVPGMVYQFVLHQDGSFSVPFVSDRIYEYSGYTPDEVMAKPTLLFKPINPEDIEFIQEKIAQSAR